MADKEERIYITEVKEGDVCPFEENCEGFYKLFEGCNVLPTRQEAINRMAKAIICRACEDYLHEDTDPLTSSASAVAYAEAALNALLDGHDDEK